MMTDREFIELLARQAAGAASEAEIGRLDTACDTSADRRARREAFLGALEAARSDDTADAPGPTLLRAYGIPTREASAPEVRVSLLAVVFDSLRPAAGLRGGATADRQLMLEGDGVTADVFIRGEGAAREIRVILEGDRARDATVHFAGDSVESAFSSEGGGEWSLRSPAGRGRIELRIGDETFVTEVLELG